MVMVMNDELGVVVALTIGATIAFLIILFIEKFPFKRKKYKFVRQYEKPSNSGNTFIINKQGTRMVNSQWMQGITIKEIPNECLIVCEEPKGTMMSSQIYGIYANKERAIKVLKELTKAIERHESVYAMPIV